MRNDFKDSNKVKRKKERITKTGNWSKRNKVKKKKKELQRLETGQGAIRSRGKKERITKTGNWVKSQ